MKKHMFIVGTIGILAGCGRANGQDNTVPVKEKPALDQKADSCRSTWEAYDEGLPAEERYGNPYLMRKADKADWNFEAIIGGKTFFVVPKLMAQFQVEEEGEERSETIDCHVPIAWQALDARFEVAMDPRFVNERKVSLVGGLNFGHSVKGGVYVRYSAFAMDPFDVNLAWHLNAPAALTDTQILSLKTQLKIPAEQALAVVQASEALKIQGPMPIEGIAFTVADEKISEWAIRRPEDSGLYPNLKLLPFGRPAAEASIDKAWAKAGILDLAVLQVWDPLALRDIACSSTAVPPGANCMQILDDILHKKLARADLAKKDICVHLAWKTQEFGAAFVSSFCVDNLTGSVRFINTKGYKNLAELGFPINP